MAESTEKEKRCIFCQIVAGDAPCYRIYEDELSLAILDVNPFSRGHCLVIPKRHVPWWHELTDDENASLFKVAKVVAEKMMTVLAPDLRIMMLGAGGYLIPISFWSPPIREIFWTGSSTPWSCSRNRLRSWQLCEREIIWRT